MQKIESYLQKIIKAALDTLDYPHPTFPFEIPKIETHGDLSVNLAMQLAGELKQKPRQIAQNIVNNQLYRKGCLIIQAEGDGS